jgi:hypothetical protein
MDMDVMFLPKWMTGELEEALRGLTRKQRTTVLKLAQAAAMPGRSMSDVFRDADCCNRSTWYDRPSRAGWESNPQIQRALELATRRAQEWQDGEIARHIETAQRKLAKAGPAAVDRLITLIAAADDQKLQRLAALDVLDRMGAGETANKAQVPSGGGGTMNVNLGRLGDDELERVIANLQTAIGSAVDGAPTTGGGDDGGGSADVDDSAPAGAGTG